MCFDTGFVLNLQRRVKGCGGVMCVAAGRPIVCKNSKGLNIMWHDEVNAATLCVR